MDDEAIVLSEHDFLFLLDLSELSRDEVSRLGVETTGRAHMMKAACEEASVNLSESKLISAIVDQMNCMSHWLMKQAPPLPLKFVTLDHFRTPRTAAS